MATLIEGFARHVERGLQRYPDEFYISYIVNNIKSYLYPRAPKKYIPIGEVVSFLSGYAIPQVILSRLIPDSPGFIYGLYPSAAPAYMLGRVVDDMADGDLDPKAFGYDDFPAYIKDAKKQLKNNNAEIEKGFGLDFLLKYTIENLEREQKPTDNVRRDWDKFFDAMLFEHYRRVNGRILTREEMKTMNDNSFSYAHNIMLISLRSKTRYKDIEEIGQLQGRIFALNDLKPELRLKIYNIPEDVLKKAKLDPTALKENPNLLDDNVEIAIWAKEEIDAGKKLFEQLRQKIPSLDLKVQGYLYFLMKGIEMGIKKAEKKFISVNN